MMFLIINLTLINIYIILYTSFLNPNKWVKFFRNLYWIDKNFGNIDQKQQFSKSFLSQILLKHIFYISLELLSVYLDKFYANAMVQNCWANGLPRFAF